MRSSSTSTILMMEQLFLLRDKNLEKIVRVSLEKYLYRSYGICYIVKEILKEVTNMKHLDMPA